MPRNNGPRPTPEPIRVTITHGPHRGYVGLARPTAVPGVSLVKIVGTNLTVEMPASWTRREYLIVVPPGATLDVEECDPNDGVEA